MPLGGTRGGQGEEEEEASAPLVTGKKRQRRWQEAAAPLITGKKGRTRGGQGEDKGRRKKRQRR